MSITDFCINVINAMKNRGYSVTESRDNGQVVASALDLLAADIANAPASSVPVAALRLPVINKTGVTIAAYQAVAVTTLDPTSGLMKIVLADADVAAHDNIWITSAAIADQAVGVVVESVLTPANINTNAATAAGDAVYLDATTPGGFTVTAPTASNARVIPIGYVVVKSLTVGQIQFLVGVTRKLGTNDFNLDLLGVDWVPADASGAGLVFTNVTGRRWRFGRLEVVFGSVTYPVTADAVNNALISLPSIPRDLANFRYAGLVVATDEATLTQMAVVQHLAQVQPLTNTGAAMKNNVLSANIVRFAAIYEAET